MITDKLVHIEISINIGNHMYHKFQQQYLCTLKRHSSSVSFFAGDWREKVKTCFDLTLKKCSNSRKMYTLISLIIGNPDETNFSQVITSPSLKHGNFENRNFIEQKLAENIPAT